MTKRRQRREPDLATAEEKLRFAHWLAKTIEAMYDQMDIPIPIGISAALMVASDACLRLDGEVKAAAIQALEMLLEQMKEPVRVMADEPTQKM